MKKCVERTEHPACAMAYATILDNGFGQRDVKQIYALYRIANRGAGNEKARNRLAELTKELSSEDLIRIQLETSARPMQPSSDMPRFREIAPR
jgi:hypothetical protein